MRRSLTKKSRELAVALERKGEECICKQLLPVPQPSSRGTLALFCRMAFAKLNTARRLPQLPARKRIRNVVFEYDLRDYRGTAPMYFGSYALLVVEAMERLLKSGDVFLDVGANIGYLSAIAAGLVGARGQVHCFEPVPAYFERLRRLAELNPDYTIIPNCCALGEAATATEIYITREPGQSTLVPSYQPAQEIVSTLKVPVVRLDDYIERHKIERPALIKIDAEGFELPILMGLESFFNDPATARPSSAKSPRALIH